MNRDDELFSSAIELPAAERAAFLDRACVGDPALRARLDALIAGHEAANSFLNHPPVARPTGLNVEKPGDVIGHYKLVRKLGEGGGGVVYLAEQSEPVRRQVALKVIKLGMDTREVITRFEGERQALAMMAHPDIARVFDAGTTDTGRPFFVMEFVDGTPITKFADDHRLPMAERLDLFVRVCHAVQHAHQKGIIHRDLKPSNILVTLHDGVATPKVIDFGIAKATQGRLTDATVATAIAQFIGTPAYMSPEQAEVSSVDIDTRSDIYSLGVVLYELLTGRTPFEPKELMLAGLDEMRRQIREVDPPRPSTRLNTLEQATLATTAGHRQIAPPKLISEIQGDLDWIVMRCLEKDRARRYDTATSLAQDLRRHLNHEPVEARPVSATYRFRKLVRRNRLAFAAAAAITLALVAGIAASTWQAIRANRAERVAQNETAIAKGMNEFLVSDLLLQADSLVQANEKREVKPDLKVREALDRAAEKVGTRFASQPRTEAAVRDAIGRAYLGIGNAAQAELQLNRALELRRRLFGNLHAETLDSMSNLGAVYEQQARFAEAAALNTEMLSLSKQLNGPESAPVATAMNNLALSLSHQGKFAEAAALYEQALAFNRRVRGPESLQTLNVLLNLGVTYREMGRHADAAPLQRQTLAIQQRVLGPEHPRTLQSMLNLASTLNVLGRSDESVVIAEQALEISKRVNGPEHPDTLVAMNNLGRTYGLLRRATEAEAVHRQALPLIKRVLGPEHPTALGSMNNLARALDLQGKYAESVVLHAETLAIMKRVNGPEHTSTLLSMGNLAVTSGKLGRFAEANALSEQALATLRRKLGPDHPNTVTAMANLARLYSEQGRWTEALPLLQQTVEIQRRSQGPESPPTLVAMTNTALALSTVGQRDEAETLLRSVLEIRQRVAGPEHADTRSALHELSNTYAAHGKFAESAARRTELIALQRRAVGAEHQLTLGSMAALATSLLELKQYPDAEPVLRELLATRERKAPDEWSTFHTRSLLGAALLGQKKITEAEPLLLSGYEGMAARADKIPPAAQVRISEALQRLVQFYTETAQPEKAAAWQKKLDDLTAATKSSAPPTP